MLYDEAHLREVSFECILILICTVQASLSTNINFEMLSKTLKDFFVSPRLPTNFNYSYFFTICYHHKFMALTSNTDLHKNTLYNLTN